MPNFSFLSGSNILVRGGVGGVGWLYSDYNASLSSNWTELDWTGTELGNKSTLNFTHSKSDLRYDQNRNIIASHGIFGRLAGG